MTAETDLVRAIAELAKAQREANALQRVLWDALPPRTRAKLLGISTSAERARRAREKLKPL